MANEHLNIVGSKLDTNFYLEQPFIGYDFIKLPRFSFTHSQEIHFNTKNTGVAFNEALQNCVNNLYPLHLNAKAQEEMLAIERWTNLFIINGRYIQTNEAGDKFAYFLIQNNDMAENYLQAFCELFKYVDIEKTKEAMQTFNEDLYEYLNFDYVVSEIEKLGILQSEDILERNE